MQQDIGPSSLISFFGATTSRKAKCQKVGYARVSIVSAEKVKDISLKG
jgi:hypothetical protein